MTDVGWALVRIAGYVCIVFLSLLGTGFFFFLAYVIITWLQLEHREKQEAKKKPIDVPPADTITFNREYAGYYFSLLSHANDISKKL